MLEHQHDQPERRGHRERVHHHGLDRHQHRLEDQREHHSGHAQDHCDEHREAIEQQLLEIVGGRHIATDPDRRPSELANAARAHDRADVPHHLHGGRQRRGVGKNHVDQRGATVPREVGVEEVGILDPHRIRFAVEQRVLEDPLAPSQVDQRLDVADPRVGPERVGEMLERPEARCAGGFHSLRKLDHQADRHDVAGHPHPLERRHPCPGLSLGRPPVAAWQPDVQEEHRDRQHPDRGAGNGEGTIRVTREGAGPLLPDLRAVIPRQPARQPARPVDRSAKQRQECR